MLTENSKLRDDAFQIIKNRFGEAVILALIYLFISSALQAIPMIGSIVSLLVTLPLGWGFEIGLLAFKRNENFETSEIFSGFKDYGRIFCTKFLQGIYVFLWSLLLIIPGVVKNYSYAMTSYILKDDPAISNNAAIEKSMAMMQGHKMKLFLLDLSFIGWIILGILTCGLGMLFVTPYMYAAHAAFYEDLKNQQVQA